MTAPDLVVVCGPPGVGKSSVARLVAEQLDGTVYRTDRVRKELFDEPEYTSEETERVYAEMLQRARRTLATGERAVLDGTYREARFREAVVEAAEETGADYTFFRVECDTEVVRERIESREDDSSDAEFEDYLTIVESFDSLECDHTRVDNSGAWERTREQVRELFPAP